MRKFSSLFLYALRLYHLTHLTPIHSDTVIQTLAAKLVSVAPKLKRFQSGPIDAATTEIRFDHRQNSIFCTCRHQWNDNVTFTI